MKNNYLIEVTQSQKICVSINADTCEQAIDKVNNQQGEVEEMYPLEIDTYKTKLLVEYE